MWSVFLFARKRILLVLLLMLLVAQGLAFDGRAYFASLLAGGLSPMGLGGFNSTPARFADPSYGTSFYWMDVVDEFSWNLSLEFGNDVYRVGAFASYASMDSLYRNTYWEFAFARTWTHLAVGVGYGLDMEWIPGESLWVRHRLKAGVDYGWRQVHFAGMLSGFTDEGVSPMVGVHWISDESVRAFAECDFDYLYVGAEFHWKYFDVCTSYRFPDFAVAVQLSFRRGHWGAAYARGFQHNSLGWNGVHVSRWLKNESRKIN